MIDTTSTTQASKKSLGILLVVLVAVLVLSLARGRLVSSLINEANATATEPASAHRDYSAR